MADYVRLAVDGGARIIGGCCGTSFAHLKAMRAALDGHSKAPRPSVADVVSRIGPMRNKPANQSGAGGEGGRRERRRARG
jgi:5-methyltetrahydrofolate--homocysteine methyltransferase